MHGKKEDVLPFVAPYLINEPSLLPPLPPDEQDEQGEEEQSLSESFSEIVEADTLSQDDQEDPFEQRHLPVSSWLSFLTVQAQAFCFTCPGRGPDPALGAGWHPVLAQNEQASFSQLAIPHSYPAGADRDSGFNTSRTGRNPAYQ